MTYLTLKKAIKVIDGSSLFSEHEKREFKNILNSAKEGEKICLHNIGDSVFLRNWTSDEILEIMKKEDMAPEYLSDVIEELEDILEDKSSDIEEIRYAICCVSKKKEENIDNRKTDMYDKMHELGLSHKDFI